jgi:hypothetical protein
MRQDVDRGERFRDAGWDIIRASSNDLRTEARRRALIDRVRRRLAARA